MAEMATGSAAWRSRWLKAAKVSLPEPDAKPPDDWREVELDLVKEVVRQAEMNLQQQAAVAQSLDQRATSLAALANAGAVAVLAFLGSQIAQGRSDDPLIAGCVAVAAAWCASAVASYLAMAPSEWRSAGFWPSQLYPSLTSKNWEMVERLGALAEKLDDACRINNHRNLRAARRFRWALGLAGTAPFIGPAAWMVARLALPAQ
jgi:hypothetical protein